jgi:hypothetical protein
MLSLWRFMARLEGVALLKLLRLPAYGLGGFEEPSFLKKRSKKLLRPVGWPS